VGVIKMVVLGLSFGLGGKGSPEILELVRVKVFRSLQQDLYRLCVLRVFLHGSFKLLELVPRPQLSAILCPEDHPGGDHVFGSVSPDKCLL
jgi:hypothetical protein